MQQNSENQLPLFDNPYNVEYENYCNTPTGSKGKTFDHKNPHIYALFLRFAYEAKNRGHKRFSSKSIIERIRWETNVMTTDKMFKISNNLTPYYSRRLMAENRAFEGFFSTKENGQ